MQYFAQDEANRLDPAKTVYETMEADSPVGMVPMIRNILGGFLFSGDDIYKKAGVLSGGERTRLAVARMLLRPANTLLLDEPTNHLDLDSKDVLLEALEDFGGTLIFVSHDRYFVDRLATKIVEVGHGGIEVYPGTYEQFLWSRQSAPDTQRRAGHRPPAGRRPHPAPAPRRRQTSASLRQRPWRRTKRRSAETPTGAGRRATPTQRERRIADLEARIAEREQADQGARSTDGRRQGSTTIGLQAESVVARHQALMWEVGDLMNQWETLQSADVLTDQRHVDYIFVSDIQVL